MTREKIIEHLKESLPRLPTGRLLLAPRFGKTRLIISLLERDKPKSVLWVTPSRKLIEEDIPNEFKKVDKVEFLNFVSFSTYKSLNKITGYFQTIILDEEQHITENNIKNIINGNLKYDNIISMTGKPSSDSLKNDIYRKLNLKVLYKYLIKEAESILSDYEINCIGIELSDKNNIIQNTKNGKFFTSEIKKYEYFTKAIAKAIENNDPKIKYLILNRMNFIYKLKSKEIVLEKLINKLNNKRNLIICSNIEQCNRFGKENTFHSKTNNEKLQLFLNKKINNLFIVNSGGTGFTYEGIENVIINQVNSDKNGNITQKIARGLLREGNKIVKIYIIYVKNTVDEKWLKLSLESFNSNKINWYDGL